MAWLSRTKQKSLATWVEGFPRTSSVEVKKTRNGELVVKNGSNLFFIPALNYSSVRIRSAEGGAHEVTGTLRQDGAYVSLAQFGSIEAAELAVDKIAKAHAGIGAGIRWVRWLVVFTLLYVAANFAVTVLRVAASQPQQMAALAPALGDSGARHVLPTTPPLAEDGFDPPGNAAPSAMSADEVERLASGGEYKFSPKLVAPKIAAPTLNCSKQ